MYVIAPVKHANGTDLSEIIMLFVIVRCLSLKIHHCHFSGQTQIQIQSNNIIGSLFIIFIKFPTDNKRKRKNQQSPHDDDSYRQSIQSCL